MNAVDSIFGEKEGSLTGFAEKSKTPIKSERFETEGAEPWLEETKRDIFEGKIRR